MPVSGSAPASVWQSATTALLAPLDTPCALAPAAAAFLEAAFECARTPGRRVAAGALAAATVPLVVDAVLWGRIDPNSDASSVMTPDMCAAAQRCVDAAAALLASLAVDEVSSTKNNDSCAAPVVAAKALAALQPEAARAPVAAVEFLAALPLSALIVAPPEGGGADGDSQRARLARAATARRVCAIAVPSEVLHWLAGDALVSGGGVSRSAKSMTLPIIESLSPEIATELVVGMGAAVDARAAEAAGWGGVGSSWSGLVASLGGPGAAPLRLVRALTFHANGAAHSASANAAAASVCAAPSGSVISEAGACHSPRLHSDDTRDVTAASDFLLALAFSHSAEMRAGALPALARAAPPPHPPPRDITLYVSTFILVTPPPSLLSLLSLSRLGRSRRGDSEGRATCRPRNLHVELTSDPRGSWRRPRGRGIERVPWRC